tara:strand:+ start:497 stop:604 length:108 start_codon:yes stop_codon:yes gene_type:complete
MWNAGTKMGKTLKAQRAKKVWLEGKREQWSKEAKK